MDETLPLDTVVVITAATNALAGYGKTLSALVADTQAADLKAAASTFSASLAAVPGSGLTTSQEMAIGTAIAEVGGFAVEAKRKKAVLAVVLNAREAVDKLCDRLILDFDPAYALEATPPRGVVAAGLSKSGEPLYGFAVVAWKNGKTYQERAAAQNGLKLAFDSRLVLKNDLVKVQKAGRSMKKANAALVAAVQENEWSFDDLLDFAEKAQSLQAAVQASFAGGK